MSVEFIRDDGEISEILNKLRCEEDFENWEQLTNEKSIRRMLLKTKGTLLFPSSQAQQNLHYTLVRDESPHFYIPLMYGIYGLRPWSLTSNFMVKRYVS